MWVCLTCEASEVSLFLQHSETLTTRRQYVLSWRVPYKVTCCVQCQSAAMPHAKCLADCRCGK
jgi:hypothetical protein